MGTHDTSVGGTKQLFNVSCVQHQLLKECANLHLTRICCKTETTTSRELKHSNNPAATASHPAVPGHSELDSRNKFMDPNYVSSK